MRSEQAALRRKVRQSGSHARGPHLPALGELGQARSEAFIDSGGYDAQEANRLLDRVRELEAEVAQLKGGLASREEIGRITGVLAVRLSVTPDVAWSFLVRLSKQMNIKVREIARLLGDGYFRQIADEDLPLAARLNEHLPASARMRLGRSPSPP